MTYLIQKKCDRRQWFSCFFFLLYVRPQQYLASRWISTTRRTHQYPTNKRDQKNSWYPNSTY
ncbi:hypothetical protein Hdeb2414_s0008g00298061 [Helianthus debilis subsp. tardiflorus]